jgi:hypothetical protein
MFLRPRGPRRRQRATSRETRILDADDSLAYCLMNDCAPRPSPLRLETRERKATARHAFPAAEIARAVAAARRR